MFVVAIWKLPPKTRRRVLLRASAGALQLVLVASDGWSSFLHGSTRSRDGNEIRAWQPAGHSSNVIILFISSSNLLDSYSVHRRKMAKKVMAWSMSIYATKHETQHGGTL
jgi:hypothetical protein